MKRLVMLFVLTLSSLAVPTLAHACWQLVSIVTVCDDCGEFEGTVTCQSGYSTGFNSCLNLCYTVPCGEGDCFGRFFVACGTGGNCSDAAPQASDLRSAPTVAILFPNSDGGYSEAAALSSSCGVSQGGKE